MKFSEKIQILRKRNGYSQEDLAEICNVSRQAISKWESNLTFPEVEKIILLSEIFHTTVDVLVKEKFELDAKIENHSCHVIKEKKKTGYFEGLLIKESITDERILDSLQVNKVELWQTETIPKYWTALYFTSSDFDLPTKLSKVMISDESLGGNWYADFKQGNTKYIVFNHKILSYEIGNKIEKEKVKKECKKMGILNSDDISE